jgi:hypothetical protein
MNRPVWRALRVSGRVRALACLSLLLPLELSTLACGQVDTAVGAEFLPDAGAETASTADARSEPDAAPCTGDLSAIGTGDFHVSLTVTSTQTGLVALVNQRRDCVPSVFWDLRMDAGLLYVEVDDVAHYTALSTTGAAINDGRPHDLAARRIAGTLTAYVDGVDAGSSTSLASLGALAPLVSGTDVCVTSSDGTAALAGVITNLCVTSP